MVGNRTESKDGVQHQLGLEQVGLAARGAAVPPWGCAARQVAAGATPDCFRPATGPTTCPPARPPCRTAAGRRRAGPSSPWSCGGRGVGVGVVCGWRRGRQAQRGQARAAQGRGRKGATQPGASGLLLHEKKSTARHPPEDLCDKCALGRQHVGGHAQALQHQPGLAVRLAGPRAAHVGRACGGQGGGGAGSGGPGGRGSLRLQGMLWPRRSWDPLEPEQWASRRRHRRYAKLPTARLAARPPASQPVLAASCPPTHRRAARRP